jgi:hypothetical protein
MEQTINELCSQLWDLEELAEVQHYLQTKDQFIKQHSNKSVDEIKEKIYKLEMDSIENSSKVWGEVIHAHFESCKREYDIKPYNTIYDSWDFWFSKYSKLLPSAWRDGIIDENEICYLLEKSGDFFAGYDTEQDLTNAWLPYNSILERVN